MKYDADGLLGHEGIDVRPEVDVPQFNDLEVVTAIEVAREFREQVLFKIGIGGSIISSPVLHKGVLYFGCNDKNLYAVSTGGEEIWRFHTGSPVMCTPRISDDAIYFGSYDGNLYALDLEGRLKWRFTTQDKVFSAPCINDQKVYFGSCDGNLYCLAARTGRELWRFATGGPVYCHPFCRKGLVIFGSDDMNLYAVGERDGELSWKFLAKDMPVLSYKTSPPVYGNMIYFGSWDRNVYAFTFEGRPVWRFTCNDTPYSIMVHNGRIYFGSRDFILYCIDARTGRELWRFATRGFVMTQPLVHRDRIYIGSGDGNLYCITLDGKKLWSFSTGGPIMSSPAVDDRAVYFGSWDCNLYAVSHDGRLLWRFHTSLSYQSPIDLELPGSREASHQVIWSRKTPETERYGKESPGLSDYGEGFEGYQSTGIRTTYMAGHERPYKSKRKYG